MKRLKERLKNISNNNNNNNNNNKNNSNNKPNVNENEEDRKIEDAKQEQLQVPDKNDDNKDGDDEDEGEDEDKITLKEWIDKLFNQGSKKKKEKIFNKLWQCYGTLEMIYHRVTDERLQQKVKIVSCKDRQVLISGVYDYYCGDNYSNRNQDQMIVHNALTDVFGANTMELKKYFVAFMNVYKKCDLKRIQQVTPDIIKQDLAMDESIIDRKILIEKILTNWHVNHTN